VSTSRFFKRNETAHSYWVDLGVGWRITLRWTLGR